MLGEDEGCDVLFEAFTRRGYAIARGVAFAEGGVTFEVDGWDAAARVGFEYLTRTSGDHDDLTPDELAELGARIDRGELYVFVIDEASVADADELRWAAERFLDEVARRRGGGAG